MWLIFIAGPLSQRCFKVLRQWFKVWIGVLTSGCVFVLTCGRAVHPTCWRGNTMTVVCVAAQALCQSDSCRLRHTAYTFLCCSHQCVSRCISVFVCVHACLNLLHVACRGWNRLYQFAEPHASQVLESRFSYTISPACRRYDVVSMVWSPGGNSSLMH